MAPSSTINSTTPVRDAEIVAFLDKDREAIGYMSPEGMRRLLFISNFDKTDPDSTAQDKHGYQRNPDDSRIPGIARFFREGFQSETPWAKPTPIIVNVRLKRTEDIETFVRLLNQGEFEAIREIFTDAVVSVVDGQHRFLGIERANQDNPEYNPRVPILFVFGLDFNDEARFFDVINVTQKRLPKALIEITKADSTEAGVQSYSQRIRLIATMLARHDESVWQHNVNLTGARDPNKPVTYEGLRRSTTSMFTKETLDRLESRGIDVDEVARYYWRLVSEACPEAWNDVQGIGLDEDGNEVVIPRKYRIRELVGVASLAKLGGAIINSALEHDDFQERMRTMVRRLSAVDWEKPAEGNPANPWMMSQAGFAGQADLYTTLYRWVYMNRAPGE